MSDTNTSTTVVLARDNSSWNAYNSQSNKLDGLLDELGVENASVTVNGTLHQNYDVPINHGDEIVVISRNKSGG